MNLGQTGSEGERAAERYFKRLGFSTCARNYQTRFGELDLVVENSQFLVFAEVKTRKAGSVDNGAQSVNAAKQHRIRTTALQYMQAHPTEKQPRFDVVLVEKSALGYKILQHIENAF